MLLLHSHADDVVGVGVDVGVVVVFRRSFMIHATLIGLVASLPKPRSCGQRRKDSCST